MEPSSMVERPVWKEDTSLPNKHRKASLTPRLVDNVECKLTGAIFYLHGQAKESEHSI